MVTIAVCDDEKEMRTMLSCSIVRQMDLLGEPCQINEFSDGAKLLAQIKEAPYRIDILFLDIEMGMENGVDIARRLRKEDKECILIFVTGYSEYVFHGYEVGALNYILKPYEERKIREVLEEALRRMDKGRERFITVPSGSSLIRIPLKEVLFFTSRLRKVEVVTGEKEWEFYGKLSDIEKQLPPGFVRTHQRYLVNMLYVERVEKDSVLLKGQELPVSRQHYQETAGAFARLLVEE